ncbi:HAD-IB family phosphatase [Streptomyces sp. S.PNR 29]|uniref:HAD family hydrolase n=1 Tax=Streptomyces sp. S.PNR 29 TaxID=2973805 RepID=UPI0025B1A4BA|nr:HAD-IB family phosphatase [Streptomyces sp. S.PNR 29]MDN0193476.1 HAD-IB family phosphatase [Streptomyces sp. S.PNR 29]
MTGTAPVPVAFFDVDETLIAAKSMLAFWDFWSASPEARRIPAHPSEPGEGPAKGLETAHRAGRPAPATAAGPALDGGGVPADRSVLNREYYRRFTGVPLADLRAVARRWYDAYRTGGRAFLTAGLGALARHRALGHEVVLVSGSLRPVLDAVAADLGATAVRCAEQAVTPDGLLTGEIDRPMIGRAKADAVEAFLAERGAHGPDCHAYGDHDSDLPMLRSVGHPVVVGGSPALLREATRLGWPVLPAHRGPHPSLAAGRRPRPAPGRGHDPAGRER